MSNFPPFSSATNKISLYNCWTIKEIIKYLLESSSGITKNTADFVLQNFSASNEVSKQSIDSISLSKNVFNLESVVDITDAIDWSDVLSAAPANHFALCSSGSKSIIFEKSFFLLESSFFNSSCIILKTVIIWRVPLGQNSDTNRIDAVNRPSAAS